MFNKIFVKLKKNNKGSALVLTVIVMINALLIVAAIAAISIVERKASTKTKNSTPALQAADSAMEWTLKRIKGGIATDTINDVCDSFNTTTGLCTPDTYLTGNFDPLVTDVEIYFMDDLGAVITDGTESIFSIATIRTVGRYGVNDDEKVSRALEVAATYFEPHLEDDSDVMILIDFSSSVGGAGLTNEKNAVIDLINDLAGVTGEDYQVGVVAFGASVSIKELVDISDASDLADLLAFINSPTPAVSNGGTNTHQALSEAYNELMTGSINRHGSNPQAIILITDGAPNYSSSAGCRDAAVNCTASSYWDLCGSSEVIADSNSIKGDGISLFSVGVGLDNLVDQACTDNANDLLGVVASYPSWYLSAANFSDLDGLLESLE